MKATQEQIENAQKNGLDASGITALNSGDRRAYKLAIDRLARRQPGNIWACTEGYKIWFDAASDSERSTDYAANEKALEPYDQTR